MSPKEAASSMNVAAPGQGTVLISAKVEPKATTFVLPSTRAAVVANVRKRFISKTSHSFSKYEIS